MPNGTRRGHTYHRNGRAYWRGPSKIARPKAVVAVLFAGGATLLALGVPQVVVGTVAVVGLVAFLTLSNRSVRRRIARKADRWAMRRAVAAGRRKPPVKKKPAPSEDRPAGPTPPPPYRRPGAEKASA